MPQVVEPLSLRGAALRTICHEFELICYGVSRHSTQYRAFLKSGAYLKHQQRPPLRQLPVHVFTELVSEVFLELGSTPHVLHAVIQPQMVECRLPSTLSTLPLAIKLLVERVNNLHTFELTCCKSLSPLILAACLPYLPSLTFLNLEGLLSQLTFCILLSNRVSTEGVVSLLVDHPSLITLEYERMKECLVLMASSPDLAKRGFQLRKVVLEGCREEDVAALEASKDILPMLEAISLNNSSLTPRLAVSLGQFAHLEKLELGNSMFTQYTASFIESVLPLLKMVGSQLTHLSLENLKFFDVTHVGRLCPKLISLKLSNILSYCRWGSITEGMLRQLLSSTRLRIINLQLVNSLTDELFKDILDRNPLPSLEFLTLEQCHGLSVGLLEQLLSQSGPLASLHVWGCANIGPISKERLVGLIYNKRLNVNFQWQDVPEENLGDWNILEDDDNDALEGLLLPLVNVNVLPDP